MVQQEAAVAHVLHSIVRTTARHLGEDPSAIFADASFFDLGADSLQMISVLRELEQEHQVKVTMRQLFEETGTPGRLAEFITARMPAAPASQEPPQPPAAREPEPVPAPAAREPEPVPAPAVREPEPAPAPAEPAREYATREELEDLAHKIHQISQIQLQMMSQLSQLLALQTAAATDRLNGKAAK